MDRRSQEKLRELSADPCARTWVAARWVLEASGYGVVEVIETLGAWLPVSVATYDLLVARHNAVEKVCKAAAAVLGMPLPPIDPKAREVRALQELRVRFCVLLGPALGYYAEVKTGAQAAGIKGVVSELNVNGYPHTFKLLADDGRSHWVLRTELFCLEGDRRRRDEHKRDILLKRGTVEFIEEDGTHRAGRVLAINACPRPRTNMGLRVSFVPHDGGLREIVLLDDVRVPEIDEPESVELEEDPEIILVP